jgi:hypothetical protein
MPENWLLIQTVNWKYFYRNGNLPPKQAERLSSIWKFRRKTKFNYFDEKHKSTKFVTIEDGCTAGCSVSNVVAIPQKLKTAALHMKKHLPVTDRANCRETGCISQYTTVQYWVSAGLSVATAATDGQLTHGGRLCLSVCSFRYSEMGTGLDGSHLQFAGLYLWTTSCKLFFLWQDYGPECLTPVCSGVNATTQQQIVDLHNMWRWTAAQGDVYGNPGPQPPAANMRQFVSKTLFPVYKFVNN